MVSDILTARKEKHRPMIPEPLAKMAAQADVHAITKLSAVRHLDDLLRDAHPSRHDLPGPRASPGRRPLLPESSGKGHLDDMRAWTGTCRTLRPASTMPL